MTTIATTNTTIVHHQPAIRLIASSRSWIDGEAIRQLYATAARPGVELAVGFPDLHPGRGAPVGAALVCHQFLHPHLIGGDIGCGMALFKTSLARRKAPIDQWADVRFDLEHPWEGDVRARLAEAGLGAAKLVDAFGTLGGGNHFAEIEAVEKVVDREAFTRLGLERDELLALIHSGSRGVGQSVLETHLEAHGLRGINANTDPDAAAHYLRLHDRAVSWAAANRALLAERFIGPLGGQGKRVLDACHNSISRYRRNGVVAEDRELRNLPDRHDLVWVHRKGATPSDSGPVVIAGTRGSLSYLVEPLGDQAGHAWSLAHGAGRKWMRSESRLRMRERFHRDELIQTPLGGRVICEERDLLYEEAPMAYKNIDVVIADLVEAGLISVIATLRPLLTYKVRKRGRG
jgi:release factor H-coupled RctB family protein